MEKNQIMKDLRVLIADDDKLTQNALQSFFSSLGIKADVCKNGTEAILFSQSKQYDLILIDYHMPEMNGLEASNFIRNDIYNQDLVIYSISAFSEKYLRSHRHSKLINEYIPKPINLTKLKNKIIYDWYNKKRSAA